MPPLPALKDVLLHELAASYDAEQQLVRALPALEKAAVAERLRRILERHRKLTAGHVTKVEAIFQHFDVKPQARPSAITAVLIEDAGAIASTFAGSPVFDAALIATVQKIEHLEIAAYGCLHEWSELLGNEPATALLREILEEEKTADAALTQLARARSNAGVPATAPGADVPREDSPADTGAR